MWRRIRCFFEVKKYLKSTYKFLEEMTANFSKLSVVSQIMRNIPERSCCLNYPRKVLTLKQPLRFDSNDATHDILKQALDACTCMEHRGASSADNVSGDGAGMQPFTACATSYVGPGTVRLLESRTILEEQLHNCRSTGPRYY